MKLFSVDWESVLSELPRWTALPLVARRILLTELKPNGYSLGARFGASLDDIVGSGIAVLRADRTRVSVAEECHELVKVLRAMHRHPVFDDPTTPALVKYIEEHFTMDEVAAIGAGTSTAAYLRTTRQTLAARAAFAGWAGDLIAARGNPAVATWASARAWPTDPKWIKWVHGLQRLAQQLVRSPNGIPLREALAGGDIKEAAFADALYAGLATLTVFAGMRRADLEPMIGLWPPAALELARPPAARPSALVPVERFELAGTMEDMTTVLAATLAAPLRLRAADGAVFARARTQIEARLVALPPWAAPFFATPGQPRVDAAVRELERLRLVRMGHQGDAPHLYASATAAAWLASTPHDRLALLIHPMRASKEVNPVGYYHPMESAQFFPFSLPYSQAPQSLNVRASLTRAFLTASDGFIPLEPFLTHTITEDNPFLALAATAQRPMEMMMYGSHGGDPREYYRNLWRSSLLAFLGSRLVSLGGASLGRAEDGRLCFMLTDIGRYLLGAAETFAYGSSAVGDVVIQPNFDVVFLGSAPATEALLARFAERVGAPPGLTFRITRASVMAAAEGGATPGDVLDGLRNASSKPLPKNVEREIAGWMATVRRATLRVVQVIDCADAETADRASALLGAKARRLNATMIELPAATPSARATTIKRLRAGGVFLDSSSMATPARAARSRRSPQPDWVDEDFPPDAIDDMDLD